MLSKALCILLEVLFHQVLYIRDVYPKLSFRKKKMYNVPVWKCMHPGVQLYIMKYVIQTSRLLQNHKALDAVIIIKGSAGEHLEEIVFEVQLTDSELESDTTAFHFGDALTSICLSLNNSQSLKTDSIGDSFSLLIRMKPHSTAVAGNMKIDINNKWFPMVLLNKPQPNVWSRIIPLKTVEGDDYKMKVYMYDK